MIEGTGPRYCPSIEDKVVRFADKNRHQVFIEPEGLYTNEMYVGGMSSSLPEDVQDAMYHSVPGLENAKIVKNAYAIEYDCINPRQLYPTLEFKNIKGLFSAGQFNGSSGYEEAAAQGLIAGINAALKLKGKEMLVLDRSEAYIGVLIDDLVTKENHEPYRMMTSRAEYRLLLRQDNADLRLRRKGYEAGLIQEETWQKTLDKEKAIEAEIKRTEHVTIGGTPEVQKLLEEKGSTLLKSGTTLAELIRRPELTYDDLAAVDKERPELPWDVKQQVEINLKYDGYIKRQMKQVEQFKKLETKRFLRILITKRLEAFVLRQDRSWKPTDRFPLDRHPGFPVFHRQTYRYCLYIWNSTEKADNKSDKEKIMAYDLSVLDQGCQEMGIVLDGEQRQQFVDFYEYLVEKTRS